MSRLDRYLLRASLPAFGLGVLLYTSMVILSATLPRLQWIVGVPFVQLCYWLGLQIPAAIPQTLPVALLLAVLLTFGRLAQSNELLAWQAGGIAMRRLIRLFLVVGLISAGASLLLSEFVIPTTNARVGTLWWELTSGGNGLFRLLERDIPVDNYRLFFDGIDRDKEEIYGVRLESWQDHTLTVLFAERAIVNPDGLELFGYQLYVLDLESLHDSEDAPQDSDAILRSLLRVANQPSDPDQSLTITTSEGLEAIITRFSRGGFEDTRSLRDAFQDAYITVGTRQEQRNAAVMFHRKLAEPFANFTLLVMALPLAVLYARSRSVAFGLSLTVTLLWSLLLALGQLLAQAGAIPVWMGMWAGNILLMLLGLSLIFRRTTLR
ncbi:MAG: LptF/LptG family permease [Deinococcota bacterium]